MAAPPPPRRRSSSVPSPQPASLYEPAPPSYDTSRPVEGWVALYSRPAVKQRVVVEFLDEPPILRPRKESVCELDDDLKDLPKLQEFHDEVSQFERAHATLQAHARGVAQCTGLLLRSRSNLCRIHEWWMDNGMNEVAHDLIPILDITGGMLPRHLPVPNTSAMPVM
ncbi:hypothetical protein FA13DRAFT_1742649 [Coprinellus micaceus]|uniref:Uncharacterized protein n=1 Tax=Coprinellus micaceus TaxID=71717 RepID=A0A4Y7SGH3_COPMI|nr:hypothetical protein FA13DRAFT_1742649 [Coprinellus micaceus]